MVWIALSGVSAEAPAEVAPAAVAEESQAFCGTPPIEEWEECLASKNAAGQHAAGCADSSEVEGAAKNTSVAEPEAKLVAEAAAGPAEAELQAKPAAGLQAEAKPVADLQAEAEQAAGLQAEAEAAAEPFQEAELLELAGHWQPLADAEAAAKASGMASLGEAVSETANTVTTAEEDIDVSSASDDTEIPGSASSQAPLAKRMPKVPYRSCRPEYKEEPPTLIAKCNKHRLYVGGEIAAACDNTIRFCFVGQAS